MFALPAPSSFEIALPEPASVTALWCAFNPNVDRSAPPPARPKKAATKKKPLTKKPAKRG